MVHPDLIFREAVTLVGGGDLSRADFDAARRLAPVVVAADGGANRLREWREGAAAVIGDMDSVVDLGGWRAAQGVHVAHLAEQETIDLEKCLYATEAPFYIGVGFIGARLDHTLAALHAMLRYPAKPVLLVGAQDVIFLSPPVWRARLAPGARVSVFPLTPVRGLGSKGLLWPLEGVDMALGARIGTSNEATTGWVELRMEGSGAALMIERRFLREAVESLVREKNRREK